MAGLNREGQARQNGISTTELSTELQTTELQNYRITEQQNNRTTERQNDRTKKTTEICVDLLFCRSIVLSFYRSVVLSFCCSVGPQKQPSPSAYAGLSPSRRKKKTKHIIAYEETPNGRDGKLAQAFSQNR